MEKSNKIFSSNNGKETHGSRIKQLRPKGKARTIKLEGSIHIIKAICSKFTALHYVSLQAD
jgi:hypothetical protein